MGQSRQRLSEAPRGRVFSVLPSPRASSVKGTTNPQEPEKVIKGDDDDESSSEDEAEEVRFSELSPLASTRFIFVCSRS